MTTAARMSTLVWTNSNNLIDDDSQQNAELAVDKNHDDLAPQALMRSLQPGLELDRPIEGEEEPHGLEA
jgi:hypothetical protein